MCQREQGSHARAVVVRPRRALHRIVVSPDDDDLLRVFQTRNLCNNICTPEAARVKLLPTNGVTGLRKLCLDVLRGSPQAANGEHISLADIVRQNEDRFSQCGLERILGLTQRRQTAAVAFPWHSDHHGSSLHASLHPTLTHPRLAATIIIRSQGGTHHG